MGTLENVESVGGVSIYTVAHERLFREVDIVGVESELATLIDAENPKLALNFERVEMVSSRMLGVLAKIRKAVVGAGGKMALFGLNEKLVRLFEVTHMAKLFVIAADEEEALGKLVDKSLLDRVRGR